MTRAAKHILPACVADIRAANGADPNTMRFPGGGDDNTLGDGGGEVHVLLILFPIQSTTGTATAFPTSFTSEYSFEFGK
jgi:hypothetical protein